MGKKKEEEVGVRRGEREMETGEGESRTNLEEGR